MLPQPSAERALRAPAAPIDRLEFAFLCAFALIATASWVGIVLVEFHAFGGRALLAGSLLAGTVAIGTIVRRLWPVARTAPTPGLGTSLVLAALVAGSLLAFFRPSEQVVDGGDGTVYLNIGRIIERAGGPIADDPLLELIPADARPSLFVLDHRPPQLRHRFPGGVQIVEHQNRVVVSFFHLFPIWIATFNLLFGLPGGSYANPMFALLGVVALFLLGRRVSSTMAGGLAAALLLVNFGQIWFARYPASEMVGQFFLLSGTFLSVLLLDSGSRLVGLAAGAAFGLAAFCRIEFLFLVSPAALVFVPLLARANGVSAGWRWYLAGFGLVTLHAAVHALFVATPYTWRLLRRVYEHTGSNLGRMMFTGLAILVVVLIWGVVRGGARHFKPTRVGYAAAAVVGGALIVVIGWPLVTGAFGRLVTPPGATASMVGLALFVARGAGPRSLLVALLFLATTATLVQASAWESLSMPIAFRRFIPLSLPLAMLFIVDMALTRTGRRWRAIPAGLVAVALGGTFLYNSWPILASPPMRGAHREAAGFASRFPDRAVILMDRSTPNHLGMSLNYLFDRTTLLVARMDQTPAALYELIHRAFAAGRPVFAVTTGNPAGGGTALHRSDLAGFQVQPVGVFPFDYLTLQATNDVFPRLLRPISRDLEIYRILPAADPQARVAMPLTIDIGPGDFAYVLKGFFGREVMPPTIARWMEADASVWLPPMARSSARGVALRVHVSAYRPKGVPLPYLAVALNGRPLGEIRTLRTRFETHTLAVPAELGAEVDRPGGSILTFHSTAFVPAEAGLGSDPRALAVTLDWLKLEQIPD